MLNQQRWFKTWPGSPRAAETTRSRYSTPEKVTLPFVMDSQSREKMDEFAIKRQPRWRTRQTEGSPKAPPDRDSVPHDGATWRLKQMWWEYFFEHPPAEWWWKLNLNWKGENGWNCEDTWWGPRLGIPEDPLLSNSDEEESELGNRNHKIDSGEEESLSFVESKIFNLFKTDS